MNRLLSFAAVAEALTGLALMAVPSIVGRLLLGAELSGVTIAVARVAGIALVALGVACFSGGEAGRGLSGMLTYSLLATLYLVYLGLGGEWVGSLLWLAAAIHAALTFLLAIAWLKDRQLRGTKAHSD
jgi:drug/metabolite transporter (DMT)-like permease